MDYYTKVTYYNKMPESIVHDKDTNVADLEQRM
jgi:hypothetical protein